jgi:ribosomal protein S1
MVLFPMKSVNGYDSFITFTDDYSRYGYIYLIKKRSEALDKFKIFKTEVENQHNLKTKIVKSNRGGSTTVDIPHMAKFLDLLQSSYRKMA